MAIDLAHSDPVNSSAQPLSTPRCKPFFQNVAFRDDVLRRIKLGDWGQSRPHGCGVFLASDAAALITGTALVDRWRLDGE